MRPVIHSQKHYVQISRSEVTTVATVGIDLVLAKASPTQVDEVKEGAIVKAIYIELWSTDAGNDGSEVVVLAKTKVTSANPTFAEMNALGTFPEKKDILFVHQGLTSNDGVGNPMVVMRGWYKIPKSKQRFGLGDELVLNIANNSLNDLEFCGFATYKEYT